MDQSNQYVCQHCLILLDLPNQSDCIRGHTICPLCIPRLQEDLGFCRGCQVEDDMKHQMEPLPIETVKAWHTSATSTLRPQMIQNFVYEIYKPPFFEPNLWGPSSRTSNLIAKAKNIENEFYRTADSRVGNILKSCTLSL